MEDPTTGALIGKVPEGTAADAHAALVAAKEAQPAWAKTAPAARGEALKAMARVIRANRVELAELLERSQHSRRGVDRADFLAWVLVASGRCARDELDEILEHFERLDVSKTGYLDAKELAALDVDAPSRMASRVSGR